MPTESWPAVWVKSDFYQRPLKCIATYGDDRPIYSNLLDGVIDRIKALLDSDHQAVILITGGTGSGKSNLALQLIRKYDKNFRIEDCYIYSPEDLAEKIRNGVDQPINWYDEGSVTLNSLNTTSKKGLRFSQFFDTMRLDHYISIICMPAGRTLNGRIAEHINMVLECPRQAPLWGFASRGFFNVKLRTQYESGKVWEDLTGTGIFRPVPKKLREQYEQVKRKKADEFKKKFVEELLK